MEDCARRLRVHAVFQFLARASICGWTTMGTRGCRVRVRRRTSVECSGHGSDETIGATGPPRSGQRTPYPRIAGLRPTSPRYPSDKESRSPPGMVMDFDLAAPRLRRRLRPLTGPATRQPRTGATQAGSPTTRPGSAGRRASRLGATPFVRPSAASRPDRRDQLAAGRVPLGT
jgi:hypothetical protein